MSELTSAAIADCVSVLSAELDDQVCEPETPGYTDSLARVFSPEASRRRPPCVVRPRSIGDVAATLRIAAATGGQVTVRGGGLSSTCVADNAVMLDLSAHLTRVRPLTDSVDPFGVLGGYPL